MPGIAGSLLLVTALRLLDRVGQWSLRFLKHVLPRMPDTLLKILSIRALGQLLDPDAPNRDFGWRSSCRVKCVGSLVVRQLGSLRP
mgnify:FL=1